MATNKIVSGAHQYTYGPVISSSLTTLGLPLQNFYLITSTGTITVRLPAASSTYTGAMITFRRKSGTDVITFNENGSNTIYPYNAVATGLTRLIASQYSTSFTCDGTNWFQLQTI
jgi:hypothetical protein